MSYWLKFNFDSAKLDGWREELQAKASRLHEVLFTRVQALTLQLQTKAIAKLSGEVLHRRTGILAGSVNASTTTDGTVITGTVQSSAERGGLWKIPRARRPACLGNCRNQTESTRVPVECEGKRADDICEIRSTSAVARTQFHAEHVGGIRRNEIRRALAESVARVLLVNE